MSNRTEPMSEKDLKPHWVRLIKLVEAYHNGTITTLKFQDDLPVFVGKIEGEKEQIDLTKE